MDVAINTMKDWPRKEVYLFHHNDSDGLTSGTILKKAFAREGYRVNRFCLEKPYPDVLKKIFTYEGKIIVFADFAGRIAPLISTYNRGRNLTIILDHHVAEKATDPLVFNLDPELYGLKGDRDMTASVTCYTFACRLHKKNEELAHIAGIGAVGDKFFIEGKLVGENRETLLKAVEDGTMKFEEQSNGESYFVSIGGKWFPCEQIADYLDILGSVGYYSDGPSLGIKLCEEGLSLKIMDELDKLGKIREKIFVEEIERIKRGDIYNTDHIQWIHVGNRFSPMGVKTIGTFCHQIKDEAFLNEKKFLAGFQVIPDVIPDFGEIAFHQVKISMRVSEYLEEKIRSGQVMGLNVLLPEATNKLGGFSDACHSLTAATTIDIGKEKQLIEEMNAILSRAYGL